VNHLPGTERYRGADRLNELGTRDGAPRTIPSRTRPDFARRPSFLYPDDGCFARAEMMALRVAQAGYARPGKVFVFGDLNVVTANAPSGSVSWWYHVAPAVRVGQSVQILDPSIEPMRPIPLGEWIGRQTTIAEAMVSACGPYAYSPSDRCAADPPDDPGAAAMESQDTYLDAEWSRQTELGRDPEQILGDHPPWSLEP
jgi:hypothetical protein